MKSPDLAVKAQDFVLLLLLLSLSQLNKDPAQAAFVPLFIAVHNFSNKFQQRSCYGEKVSRTCFCAWEHTEAVGTQSVMNYDSSHGWINYGLKKRLLVN